ncbi:YcbK family protein [Rhizobium sp. C4]|uniref:YcbK family protein n=1 Tax=Rhizobium sp. C4 TaxID=1349800 RepID=UPI001E5841C3|nr:D-Ala-D-Ala carboxypeptidase family metallohydrolase [Rhizobium sp. C4]MCD2175981.1 D-Ala-D-Ala carboxypeptidase family metallohydrolase [Rhizobium sp. C4]
MKQQQPKGSAERRLYALSTGLLTALALSGCMSSSFESSFDPKLVADARSQQPKAQSLKSTQNSTTPKTQRLAINPETAQEVEIRNGEPVAADQQAVIAAATQARMGAIPIPRNAAAFRPTNRDQQIQVALNAARGSIFSTAPPKPEEAAAAEKSGVKVPTSVPAPSFNPSVINIYTPAETEAAAPDAEQAAPAAVSDTAAPEDHPATPKGGRVLTPAETQQPAKVASLFTMQPQNPAAVPMPTEPPAQDFNAGRFSQPQAQEQTNKLEPANPLRLQTPQPANPLSATPDDGSRPVAKLNAFFPPKPKPAAVEGEGDDGDTGDDSADDSEPAGLMRLISAPGLARVAPNGIWIQTPYVETDCFKPELMKMLHTVEKHYGKPPIVTSGYRPPVWNSKSGGAEHSLHTTCNAADIQVNGVSKWELANFLRALPERGGVGTYCYTNSVHIDTGDQRDWDWRCHRKKKKHR